MRMLGSLRVKFGEGWSGLRGCRCHEGVRVRQITWLSLGCDTERIACRLCRSVVSSDVSRAYRGVLWTGEMGC
jgi:hypothetical protein